MVHILDLDDALPAAARADTPGKAATAAYLFTVFLGLPLILHDGYFDITETKHLFFLCASALYILSIWLLWLFGRRAVLPFQPVRALSAADIGMELFALAYVAGALLSPGTGAWIGASGRYQGAITVLVYALVYFCLSRNFCFLRLNAAALAAGLALASLLAVLNDFGLDPLGIMRALAPRQRWQFVSALGNTNFYSGWLGALLPVALCGWCFAQRRITKWLSGITFLCACLGMLPTASESFVLALMTALWLLPPFLFDSPPALRRYLWAVAAMALTLGLMRLLMRAFPTVQYLSFSLRLLSQPAVTVAVLLICAVLLFCLRARQTPLGAKKAYFLISLALVLLIIGWIVLRNTVFSGLSFGYADRFLRLDASWGTDRGRIWRYCLSAFGGLPPLGKLTGGGAGYLYAYDALHPLFPDAFLDSAHNEYLQYLLSCGIIGLGGYLTFLAAAATAALKRAARTPLSLAFMLGALAYAAQAAVNIAQPISTPYLFLLLSMAAGCACAGEDRP